MSAETEVRHRSPYSEAITEHLKALGREEVDPTVIEAWMRVEHSTLDALAEGFRDEVKIALRCMDTSTSETNEALAASYGFRPKPTPEPDSALLCDDAAPSSGEYTWTEHTSKCRGCGGTFRISEEAIKSVREGCGYDTETDAEVAGTIDFCLQCVSGVIVEGEKVEEADAQLRAYIVNVQSGLTRVLSVAEIGDATGYWKAGLTSDEALAELRKVKP